MVMVVAPWGVCHGPYWVHNLVGLGPGCWDKTRDHARKLHTDPVEVPQGFR